MDVYCITQSFVLRLPTFFPIRDKRKMKRVYLEVEKWDAYILYPRITPANKIKGGSVKYIIIDLTKEQANIVKEKTKRGVANSYALIDIVHEYLETHFGDDYHKERNCIRSLIYCLGPNTIELREIKRGGYDYAFKFTVW